MKRSMKFKVNGVPATHQTHDGRDVLIVPVVAICEGVLNGMLALFDEFSAYPSAWEGIPLPVSHPRKDGVPVTANTPDVLESDVIGRLHNVTVDADAKSLKGELWIDVVKAQAHASGPEIMRRLEAGEPLEVSTGYFCDMEEGTGIHSGERYNGIQRNFRPDHLALLPNGIGACNWDDGCGAPRVAEQEPQLVANAGKRETRFYLMQADMSFDDISNALRNALNAEDPSTYHWLADVFDDMVIYEIEPRAVDSTTAAGLFRRSYSILEGVVNFGEPKPVRRKTIYEDVPATAAGAGAITRTTSTTDLQDQPPEVNVDKKAIVDKLITDTRTPWKEEHRVTLMAMSECEVKTLVPAEAAAAPVIAAAEPAVVETTADVLAGIKDAKIRKVIEDGIRSNDRRKAELVTLLTANRGVAFSKVELEAMDLDFLEKLAPSLGISYAGANTPRSNDRVTENADDEVPMPPRILTAPLAS